MGVFGRALGEGLEKAALYLGDRSEWLHSAESTLRRSKSGIILADAIRNEYEPAVARVTAYNKTQGLMSHEDATALAHKQVRNQMFGKKNELLVKALDNIHKETNAVHVNNAADAINVYFRDSNKMAGQWRKAAIKAGVPLESAASNYTAPRSGERFAKKVASYIYLPRVVLPHLGQPLNTLLSEGFAPTLKAGVTLLKMGSTQAAQVIRSSGAMEEELFRQMKLNSGPAGGWFKKVFHMPGFNYVRRMQVTASALAGEYALKDAFAEFAKGNTSKDLMLTLEKHGVKNPQALLRTGLTDEVIDRARYIAAQKSMFISSGLDTPYRWQENWTSRLATLYQSYAFNQGRFLTNHIKDAFYKGGPETWLRTMAVLGVAYPMVGEGIKQLEGLATLQKPREEDNILQTDNKAVNEYVDAAAHVAGFGIYYQMIRSVKHRMFAEFLTGPIVGSVADLIQDAYSQGTRKNKPHKEGHKFKDVPINLIGRDFARRVPLIGAPLANTLYPRKTKKQKKVY